MAFASLTVATYAVDPARDLIWGPGGYVASLDRVQVKGTPDEQDQAAREEKWLNTNEQHVKRLMEWLRLNNKLQENQ